MIHAYIQKQKHGQGQAKTKQTNDPSYSRRGSFIADGAHLITKTKTCAANPTGPFIADGTVLFSLVPFSFDLI
jgi:hypothetical protein